MREGGKDIPDSEILVDKENPADTIATDTQRTQTMENAPSKFWRPEILAGREDVAMGASNDLLTARNRELHDNEQIIRQSAKQDRFDNWSSNRPLEEAITQLEQELSNAEQTTQNTETIASQLKQKQEELESNTASRALKIASARSLGRLVRELDPDAQLHHLIKTRLAHGTEILVVDQAFIAQLDQHKTDPEAYRAFVQRQARMEADIIMTDLPHVPLMVNAADCGPMGLFDTKTGAVAVVHAGWKGTTGAWSDYGDAVSRTLEAMHGRYGTEPQNLIAVIGPYAAGPEYQLSGDMRHIFESATNTSDQKLFTDAEIDQFLVPDEQKNFRFDNGLALKITLEKCGMLPENIETSPHRTMTQDSNFSSERIGKQQGKDYDTFAFMVVRKK